MFPTDLKTLILEFADEVVLSQIKKRVILNSLIIQSQSRVRWIVGLHTPPRWNVSICFKKGIRFIKYMEKRMGKETLSNFDKMKLPTFPQKK